MIDDLLEVARIEENAIDLDLEPIAPGAFVAEIEHEWEVRFQQEGAKVFVDVAEDAPVIHADKGLLKRVFANLIQNALTHTANGVEITLMRAPRYGDGRHPVHGGRQRPGDSAGVSRADLSQVRACEAAGGAAGSELGAGAGVLQIGGGGPRRADLGAEHGGAGEPVSYSAPGAAARAAVGGIARGVVSFEGWPTVTLRAQ